MSDKVLIVTVGGTRYPVVTAHQELSPIFTFFVVTEQTAQRDGSEYVLKNDGNSPKYEAPTKEEKSAKEPSILKQLNLTEEQYSIVCLKTPDDVSESYSAILRAVEEVRERFPEAEIVVDITGGTKSMSAAATIVAYEEGLRLSVVQGNRSDLVKTWGDSFWSHQHFGVAELRREVKRVQERIESRNYREAVELCKAALADGVSSSLLEAKQLRKLRNVALAFAAWDEFQHQEAAKYLRPYGRDLGRYIDFASQVERCTSVFMKRYERDKEAPMSAVGVELISDIYLNAMRRGEQQKYDDAVARLYRALELQVQVLLLNEYGLITGNVDVQALEGRLPQEELRNLEGKGNQKGKVQIGLLDSYDLLASLNERLRPMLSEYRSKLMNWLEIRNKSILAHGLRTVTKEQYEDSLGLVTEFFQALDRAIGRKRGFDYYPQFPREIRIDAESL